MHTLYDFTFLQFIQKLRYGFKSMKARIYSFIVKLTRVPLNKDCVIRLIIRTPPALSTSKDALTAFYASKAHT